ncbi:hypothetical protein BDR06DRAFT_950434 [Suillus hirtellus]|nr:hypothetical protein BDR06DRAFT_950434 [Suillus hirtellus]
MTYPSILCTEPSLLAALMGLLIHFWDKDARTLRLKTFEAAPGLISATTFNRNGTIFAYAVSYDWSKGHSGMTPGHPNKLMLHACMDDEVKRRPKK